MLITKLGFTVTGPGLVTSTHSIVGKLHTKGADSPALVNTPSSD